MFQFRAFPSRAYLIQRVILEFCSSVLPHSVISGSKLICSSPKLFAACHDLHRLLMPRHSPCALYSLTCSKESFTSFRPSFRRAPDSHSVPLPLSLPRKSALAASLGETKAVLSLCFWFSIKNYAGSTELLNKIVFTLKVPQLKFILKAAAFAAPLCCLAFSLSFLCSVLKVQLREYPQN